MLRLRPYKRCDGKTIAAWFEDDITVQKWCAGRYKNFPLTGDEINAYYDSMAESDSFFPMSAFDEDGLAGQLIMRFTDEEKKVLRFAHVVIDDKKRGRGYGKELIRLSLKYAFDIAKAEKVTLGVFKNNPQALACYLAVGFEDLHQDSSYEVLGENWECYELEIKKDSFG